MDPMSNKIFSGRESLAIAGPKALWTRLRHFLRFDHIAQVARILNVFSSTQQRRQPTVVTVHRIEETINGRTYQIEAMLVDPDRWRAYLVSASGGSTALMPFYGTTPEQAVQQLSDWLTLAHQSPTIPV